MTVKELIEALSQYPDNCEVKHTIDPENDVSPWVYIGIDKVDVVASTIEEINTDKATVLLIS